jgi:hypothetical protein
LLVSHEARCFRTSRSFGARLAHSDSNHWICRSSRSFLPFLCVPVPNHTGSPQTALPSQISWPTSSTSRSTCRQSPFEAGTAPYQRSTAVPPGQFKYTDSTSQSGFFLVALYLPEKKVRAEEATALPGHSSHWRSSPKSSKISTSQSNKLHLLGKEQLLPHSACGSKTFHRTSQSAKPHLPVVSPALPSRIYSTSRSRSPHFPVLLNKEARCSSCLRIEKMKQDVARRRRRYLFQNKTTDTKAP